MATAGAGAIVLGELLQRSLQVLLAWANCGIAAALPASGLLFDLPLLGERLLDALSGRLDLLLAFLHFSELSRKTGIPVLGVFAGNLLGEHLLQGVR